MIIKYKNTHCYKLLTLNIFKILNENNINLNISEIFLTSSKKTLN